MVQNLGSIKQRLTKLQSVILISFQDLLLYKSRDGGFRFKLLPDFSGSETTAKRCRLQSLFVYLLLVVTVTAVSCSENQMEAPAPESIPEGMVYIPGGSNWFGSEDGLANERPVIERDVEPFFMDKHPVTVAEFRAFVDETGYVTETEEIGSGVVFDFERGEWTVVEGANWRYPNGPDGEEAEENHPVRQVSIADAKAYLEWADKRLPTEFEWEHAAKGGKMSEEPYAWGESLVERGEFRANTWNGTFPVRNTGEDGYLQTAPVGEFAISELGLTDMGGNVWEWTDSWYRPYDRLNTEFTPTRQSEKVLRGGSFMCHVSYCHGYRVSARSHTPPDNALFHVGFRGVKDVNLDENS
jgi:sulfatase modifying factor 1